MTPGEVELVVAFCKIGAVFGTTALSSVQLPPGVKNFMSLLFSFPAYPNSRPLPPGTFLGGGFMQKFGRRPAIASCAVLFVIGPLAMALSGGVTGLCAGRFIVGLGIGASAVVTPAYLGEMSPAEKRGSIVALYEVMLCVGMLSSGVMDYLLAEAPHNWRWMVAMPIIPGAVLGTALFLLPESPRFLMYHRDTEAAFQTITRLRHDTLTGETPRSKNQRNAARDELELLHLWSEVEKEMAEQAANKEMLRQRRISRNLSEREVGEALEGVTSLPYDVPGIVPGEAPNDVASAPGQVEATSPRTKA